jgi:DNA-binding beta-propeller fold protein YncE
MTCVRFLVLLILVAGPFRVLAAQTRAAGLLNFRADGQRVACSNRDSGTVTILSWPDMKTLCEVSVGHHPEGVAWLGGSSRLACCVYGDDKVVVIDSDSGSVVQTIDVFDEPYGIVSNADGSRLYVTLEYPGQVVAIDTPAGAVTDTWPAGHMPRGLALSHDDQKLYVTEYLTAKLLELSTDDGRVLREWAGASTDNLARQVVLSPDGRRAYLTNVRSRVSMAHGNGSIFPNVSVARLTGEKAGTRTRIPMDAFRGTRVVANPWDCDVSPDGQLFAVAFAGTNDLFVCRVVGDDYVELEYLTSVRLGSNPRAVRFSPDGRRLLVYNALDFDVQVIELADGKTVSRTAVTACPLSDEVRLGKTLFYTALAPMTSRNWISCSSCHPDGDADGRTWQQPEGLRNTQPLAGLGWTHPLHWSADRDEVQDFEHTIQGKLMQGDGLLKGDLSDALGEPLSGRSRQLDALAAYTNSHRFPMSPHAKSGLSESALRGRELFFSPETQCSTCHAGPLYTDSQPRAIADFKLHDVGTGGDDASELMGPKYDTPTLLGVYRSAPYLHHGRAATLRDVLTTSNSGDRHGRTSHLTDSQVDDLVEFLKSLPYEDVEPQAEEAGLTRITR